MIVVLYKSLILHTVQASIKNIKIVRMSVKKQAVQSSEREKGERILVQQPIITQVAKALASLTGEAPVWYQSIHARPCFGESLLQSASI